MLRRIGDEVRRRVVRLWLAGLTYREIKGRLGRGLGTISTIVGEARKAEPDIDLLRELNMALRKSGVAVVDAIRACSILPRLDELGIGVNELAQYVELSKKLAEEHLVDPAELVKSAIKLSRLEKETGKARQELLKEFEEKVALLKELDGKIQNLRKELKDARKRREISRLCEQLKAVGIKPSRLQEFIAHKGSLKKQISTLEEELEQGKARLKILTKTERDIQRRVDDIQRIERILHGRVSSFACPYCGWVTPHEVRRFEVQMALSNRQPLTVVCQRCRATNQYDPSAFLINLGLEVLS